MRPLILLVVASLAVAAVPACSQGEGEGEIGGTLNVPNCWTRTRNPGRGADVGVSVLVVVLVVAMRTSDCLAGCDPDHKDLPS